jgi:hypothetical protein
MHVSVDVHVLVCALCVCKHGRVSLYQDLVSVVEDNPSVSRSRLV